MVRKVEDYYNDSIYSDLFYDLEENNILKAQRKNLITNGLGITVE